MTMQQTPLLMSRILGRGAKLDPNEEIVTMQIAQVNKALGSVAYFVDRGYQVVSDKDDETGEDVSRMTHKASGRVSKFRRERNIWILDAFTRSNTGFIRPGAQ